MTEAIQRFDFRNLFVLDLANNHQGSVEHGKAIIERCADVVAKHGVRAALKFQFRDLDTFVHVDHLVGSNQQACAALLVDAAELGAVPQLCGTGQEPRAGVDVHAVRRRLRSTRSSRWIST